MRRATLLALLALPACSTSAEDGPRSDFADPRAFVIEAPDGHLCTAVAVGPWESLTAGHCGRTAPLWYSVADGREMVVTAVPADEDPPARLSPTSEPFAAWYDVASPATGNASIVTGSGTRQVWLSQDDYGATWRISGYVGAPGESGSPVLQRGAVVAVMWGSVVDPHGWSIVVPARTGP